MIDEMRSRRALEFFKKSYLKSVDGINPASIFEVLLRSPCPWILILRLGGLEKRYVPNDFNPA